MVGADDKLIRVDHRRWLLPFSATAQGKQAGKRFSGRMNFECFLEPNEGLAVVKLPQSRPTPLPEDERNP